MTYKKDKWIEYVKKAVEDTKALPSSGKVCAIAAIRYMRDGLTDDIGETSDDDKAFCTTIRDCMNELIKEVNKSGASDGFASNASAAAKAAGFKGQAVVEVELES